jgi:transketolase
MEINSKNIKLWSIIGPRASLGLGILDLAKHQKELMVVTCDVSTSAGLDRFRKTFPDQYIDLGIAEQNMIGVSTGLASENFKVITTTFAPFQTMRCCEQIKVNLGYMEERVTMIGLASGLVLGNLGFTHCCIEDIGALRSIPNLNIVSPADSLETIKSIEESLNSKKSTYIRITGGTNNPIIYESDYKFEIGRSITLKKGNDVTIFGCGAILGNCMLVAKALNDKKISAGVINMHTIKPIDREAILEAAKKSKLIVTVEEHNKIGGLGSAISEVLSSISNSPKQLILGINDSYTKSGAYNFLKDYYRLTPAKILEDIKNSLNDQY